jgi:hypothetical protein|tara:strand:+ start:325 stop:516 length:192 start_codon:yes stop_codon:yes gene_type:complete
MKVSRLDIIKKLLVKEYKALRPTAEQISAVISKYDLNLYNKDGNHRSKEVMTKAVAKAYKVLR